MSLKNIFRIIRIQNLLIIVLSQVLIHYCLILPVFVTTYFITDEFPAHLSDINFILLVLSTVFVASAGYIINDYFDIDIDKVNKPGKNIVGKDISRHSAKRLFFILSGLGIIIGFYLAILIDKPVMGLIHVFSATSLWMYSSHFKRRLFSGNVIVALLCALSILTPGLFEPEFYSNIVLIFWFAVPAFLLSFARELIKDIEDLKGDELSQCNTAPIALGITATKIIIAFLILSTITFITYILYENFYINKIIGFWYLLLMFIIPLLALLYLALSAGEKRDYHYASLFAKILMLAGILTLLPFWYYFVK